MIADVLVSLTLLDSPATHLLTTYYEDLLRFNRALNLVSRHDAERRAAVLIGEACLAAWRQNINENEYILDLGSGAGIPGIPTVVCRPDAAMVLLERRRGRCDFLRREVRALKLKGVEVAERDASAPGELAGRMDRVLLKAVAAPARALELARPYLAPGGRAVVYREAGWDAQEAGPSWTLEAQHRLQATWMDREVGIFELIPA